MSVEPVKRLSRRAPAFPRGTTATAPTPPPAPPGLYAGTSGWAYASWKPGFYPAGVPARRFLSFYASRLNSTEVNYSFRKLPTPEQIAGWLAAVPEGFRFSFKAPQRITHFARLRDCEEHVRDFLAAITPVRRAGKLGILLFQLPPNFRADPERLKGFLALRALRGARAPKIAFEFRHASWFTDEIFALLRRAGAALCVAETEEFVTPDIQTAPHRCYRLRVSGGYTPRALAAFARRFAAVSAAGETFVYFKHEDAPTGALHATALLARASKIAAPEAAR